MGVKERIFHACLFELGAIFVSIVLVMFFADTQTNSAFMISVMIAVTAVVWNFIFNIGFDKIFTAPRETRGLWLRIFHTVSFELGLLLFTVPLIAYYLQLSLWQAFWLDIGLTLAIMLYALIFNWGYDNVRLKFI
ncbi:hypothetical protein C5N92_00650 [Glaesserella australis]|uniref:Chlorhexidine efflux transporter domain-containing protein n=2 Tax=Pasteurellaceae TaxID=712 RepID=A0A328C621_9PAST|nr:hypothetical protein CJD39_09880 [Glaesserella sp. 15-184]RAL19954.1 hypothetical protein C5N92_00650 [Glaesserella australis]